MTGASPVGQLVSFPAARRWVPARERRREKTSVKKSKGEKGEKNRGGNNEEGRLTGQMREQLERQQLQLQQQLVSVPSLASKLTSPLGPDWPRNLISPTCDEDCTLSTPPQPPTHHYTPRQRDQAVDQAWSLWWNGGKKRRENEKRMVQGRGETRGPRHCPLLLLVDANSALVD